MTCAFAIDLTVSAKVSPRRHRAECSSRRRSRRTRARGAALGSILFSKLNSIRRRLLLLSAPLQFSILPVSRSRHTVRCLHHLVDGSRAAQICMADFLVDLESTFQELSFRGNRAHDRNKSIVEPKLARTVPEGSPCMRFSSSGRSVAQGMRRLFDQPLQGRFIEGRKVANHGLVATIPCVNEARILFVPAPGCPDDGIAVLDVGIKPERFEAA